MFRFSPAARFGSITIWGGGTMGGGIAQVTAQAGMPATIVETGDDRVQFSKKTIAGSLARVAKKKHADNEAAAKATVDSVMSNITFTTDAEGAASKAELIVEAILENMEVKHKLWSQLDKVAPKECVFASNTSSLSITEQSKATTRPERFGGLHFFSPVPMMKLVEIVKTEQTSLETVTGLAEYAKKIGKSPVVCQDTPGFIVNRLLIPLMQEAARLVERGVASVEDVDTAMKLGAGHPMGPFTLLDSVGIDVQKHIIDGWHKEQPDVALFNPSKLIDDKFAEGKLGRKSGEGFYKYK